MAAAAGFLNEMARVTFATFSNRDPLDAPDLCGESIPKGESSPRVATLFSLAYMLAEAGILRAFFIGLRAWPGA